MLLRPRKAPEVDGRPLVIGHRGAPGSHGIPASRDARTLAPSDEEERYAPENTFSSFERALGLGADLVELDVQLTRDEEVVVIHDATVDRTTDGSGRVAAMALAELQRLDAGSWYGEAFRGEQIPTLAGVLGWARGRVPLAIELKSEPWSGVSGLGSRVADALVEHGMEEQVVVISFDHRMVARFKRRMSATPVGLLYVCRPTDVVALARAASADLLMPLWSYAEAEDVAAAHEAGLAVAPWVTSDPLVLRKLVDMRVDAIGTNHPDRLRAVLDG